MKRKVATETSVRLRAYSVVYDAVESACALGVNRAYKHTDKPDRALIAEKVSGAVMNALCEVMDFGEEQTE